MIEVTALNTSRSRRYGDDSHIRRVMSGVRISDCRLAIADWRLVGAHRSTYYALQLQLLIDAEKGIIPKGTQIKVIAADGLQIKVRRVEEEA